MSECKANGCPLPVDFTSAWKKNDSGKRVPAHGVCRYHRMVSGDRWTVTTTRIRTHLLAIRSVHFLIATSDPIYRPMLDEAARDWLARIEKNINLLITGRDGKAGGAITQVAAAAFKDMLQDLKGENHD